EEALKKRTQKRSSTSDLVGRRREEEGTLVARELREQALAKQTATLRTIKEKESAPTPPRPAVSRKSAEYNGRPSIMLGAELTRGMRWAEGNYEPTKPEKPKIEKTIIEKTTIQKAIDKPHPPKPIEVEAKTWPQPEPPKPKVEAPIKPPPPKVPEPDKDAI